MQGIIHDIALIWTAAWSAIGVIYIAILIPRVRKRLKEQGYAPSAPRTSVRFVLLSVKNLFS